MVDFLKNAFGGAFSASASGGTSASNEFVGQTIDLGQGNYRIRRLIAEGGFAYVYEAQEVTTGAAYAVKRLLAVDEVKTAEIVSEINFMKKLSGHPNIVRFVTAASIDKQASARGMVEYIVVMELCTMGRLVDVLARRAGRKLSVGQVCQIMHQTASAVRHCHSQRPPIVHRDLKLENLLLDARGVIKLCDFGSATTNQYEPDGSWTASRRSIVEDEITRNTTPMYRAPEMLDTYQNAPIGTPADVWMLGCVLFALCFDRHPFDDSAKLKILNAKYTIPPTDRDFLVFHELIRIMLQVDPRVRPDVDLIIAGIEQLAHESSTRGGNSPNLDGPVELLPQSASAPQPPAQNAPPVASAQRAPPRPPPLVANGTASQPAAATQPAAAVPPRDPNDNFRLDQTDFSVPAQGAQSSMFSALKSGAGAFFTKVKDASSRVKDAMQVNINQPGQLDVSYLTSRILVMSYPSENIVEQALRANNALEVRTYLDRKHGDSYAVINLSMKTYSKQRFADRVLECAINPKRAPSLAALIGLSKNMHTWLQQTRTNCIVLHCLDGRVASCMLVCAFLCFERFFDNADASITFFSQRRVPVQLTASQRRYINYVCKIVHPEQPLTPQPRFFKLLSLTIKPVPLFNRTRNGCRPYLEIFRGQESIFTSLSDNSFDSIRIYAAEHGRVQFEPNSTIYGDITVCCNHARVQNAAVANRFTSVKIFDMQFHTGYLDVRQRFVHFEKQDLDYLDSPDKYPEGFLVVLEIEAVLSDEERQRQRASGAAMGNENADSDARRNSNMGDLPPPRAVQNSAMPWDSLPSDLDPRVICQSDEEFQNVLSTFGPLNRNTARLAPFVSTVNESYYAELPLRAPTNGPSTVTPSAPPRSEIYADRFVDADTKPSAPPLSPPSAARRSENDTNNFFNSLSWEANTADTDTATQARQRSGTLDMLDQVHFGDFSKLDSPAALREENVPADIDVDDLIDVGDVPKPTAPPTRPNNGPSVVPKSADTLEELFGSVSVESTSAEPARAANLLNFDDDRRNTFELLNGAFPVSQSATKRTSVTGAAPNISATPVTVTNAQRQSVPTANLLDGVLFGDTGPQQAGPTPAPSRPNPSLLDDIFSSTNVNTQIPTAPMQPQTAAKPPSPLRNPLLDVNFGIRTTNSQPDLTKMNPTSNPSAKVDPFSNLNFGPPPTATKPNLTQAQKSQYGITPGAAQPASAGPGTTTAQPGRPTVAPKPNYDSNLFGDARKPPAGYTGVRPPGSASDFADLLGDKLGSAAGPRTFTPGKAKLNEMLVAKEVAHMTPDEAKVYAWSYGKEGNLRGMLASLHTVITWQTDRWTSVALHEIVQPDQVRRYYKRACLAVHPDKLGDDNPNQNMGRLILMELNKAHETFEKNELEAEMQTPAS